MAVPLLVGDRVVGTLLVSSYLPHAFAPTDLQFLTLFASEVAPALEASRLLVVEQRQKVVEEASRAKSTFLANMSHELRTPLNAILGFTDLLEEQLAGTLSERQRTFVAHIRDAGQHLLALINDVLDLSRVESGRLELRPERVELSSLVAPVTASAQTDAAARGVLWRQDPLPNVQLMLDVGRIRQVLYNLLSNAMKFTPTGGTVSLRAVVQDATLRFEVRDSGIGIPAAQHHRVFGTFERLHEGSHTAGGTGLGLALTKQLVEVHGGSIAFESVEGQGSCFTVALPGVVAPTITGARVLVVENDPGDAALVAALAAEAEVQTEVVPTVDEALNALARERPLGVVLDLRLPGARGEMLFEAMQRDPATARIPVVVITVEEADRRNTTRLIGIDDYLTKPIDAARLGSWFKRVAQRR
jgi:signal transduction histidine kinase